MVRQVNRAVVADAPLTCRNCARGGVTLYRGVHSCIPDELTTCRTRIRKVAAGRPLYRQGEIPQTIYSVHDGWLCRVREIPGGRKQILSFIIPGDTITYSSIFMPGQALSYGIMTVSDVVLCAFDAAKFRLLLLQRPEFSDPYHQDLAEYLETVTCRLADLGQRSAKGRMSQLFVELYIRHQKRNMLTDDGFAFPVSQALLGNALGMTKTYVNRSIFALRREGLISLEAGSLHIPDVLALQKYADAA